MKKIIFSSLLIFAAMTADAQIFVAGLRLDSIQKGPYLIVEQVSEIGDKVFLKVEADKRFDKKGLVQQDWLTDKKGERKPFATRTSALNFLYENGWMVAFVLSNDSLGDNRLLLQRILPLLPDRK